MKTLVKDPKKLLGKDLDNDKTKNSRWKNIQKKILLPVDCQRLDLYLLEIAVDRTVDRFFDLES